MEINKGRAIIWILGFILIALSYIIKTGEEPDILFASGALWGIGITFWASEFVYTSFIEKGEIDMKKPFKPYDRNVWLKHYEGVPFYLIFWTGCN